VLNCPTCSASSKSRFRSYGQIDSNAFQLGSAPGNRVDSKNPDHCLVGFLGSLPERVATDAGYLDLPRQITLRARQSAAAHLEYLLDTYTATTNFEYFDTIRFVGHTHLPSFFTIRMVAARLAH